MSRFWLGVIGVSVAMVTYVVAQRFAPAAQRYARVSVIAACAGTTAACLFFGVWSVVGGDNLEGFYVWRGHPWFEVAHGNWSLLAIAMPSAVVAAVLMVRRSKPIPWSATIGSVLVIGAIIAGERLGAGTMGFDIHGVGDMPSFALRAALMALGGIGVVLIVSRFILRAHAREDAVLAQYAS